MRSTRSVFQPEPLPQSNSVVFPGKACGSLGGFGSVLLPRFTRPVFRICRDPSVGLFFGSEIANMRIRTVSRNHPDGPATVFNHFRMEFGLLGQHARTF